TFAAARRIGDRWARRIAAGVPARAAQPFLAGPVRYQAKTASGSTIAAVPATARRPIPPEACPRRRSTDTATAAMHPTARAAIQPKRASLPVPSEWTRASGQEAYASQCVARQVL